MPSDADPMLETDHLEQLLETPAPPQPVVVVQYRNRGVPPWVFLLFVMLVFPITLYVYHRTVIEKYNVRAAQDRSLLALQIKEERALMPLVRDAPSSNAVLPEPKVAAAGAGTDDVPGSVKSGTERAASPVAASPWQKHLPTRIHRSRSRVKASPSFQPRHDRTNSRRRALTRASLGPVRSPIKGHPPAPR